MSQHAHPPAVRTLSGFSCAGVAASLIVLASAAHAGQIPVVNHSFESPAFQPCQFGGPVPGWTSTCSSSGAWNAGLGNQCAPLNGFPGGVPDGAQNGFVNCQGIPVVQVVQATVVAGEQYTLLVDVGRRSDGFPVVSYRIRLVAGGHILAEDDDSLEPPPGGWLTSTIGATVPSGHPAVGHPLEIQLFVMSGPQANFDNVRLFEGPYSSGGVPGDLDGDGAVNGADLGQLLGSWGPCADCAACPADLNGDCTVNGSDLGILLGSWG